MVREKLKASPWFASARQKSMHLETRGESSSPTADILALLLNQENCRAADEHAATTFTFYGKVRSDSQFIMWRKKWADFNHYFELEVLVTVEMINPCFLLLLSFIHPGSKYTFSHIVTFEKVLDHP